MSLVAALLRLMTFAGVVYKQDTVKQTCWCSENLVLFSQPLIFFHIKMYDSDIKKLGQREGNNVLHWGIFVSRDLPPNTSQSVLGKVA